MEQISFVYMTTTKIKHFDSKKTINSRCWKTTWLKIFLKHKEKKI